MPQQASKLAARMKAEGMKLDPKRLEDLTGDPMGAVISRKAAMNLAVRPLSDCRMTGMAP